MSRLAILSPEAGLQRFGAVSNRSAYEIALCGANYSSRGGITLLRLRLNNPWGGWRSGMLSRSVF
ncbi:hypothetical protein GcM1_085004 [Golovinomyces cichoracearum]|uniref:Uncharacterized protein n=1 Tax=Golovinomyces cichoracearum TaxID=62708 RepID=A0A420JC64_9PEZI|nr:hypothetical protein GcM1_085004 [Golovinomyces cichoracearum]